MEVLQTDHSIKVTTIEYDSDEQKDDQENFEDKMEDINLSSSESLDPSETKTVLEVNDKTKQIAHTIKSEGSKEVHSKDDLPLNEVPLEEEECDNNETNNGLSSISRQSSETYVAKSESPGYLSHGDVVGSRLAAPDVTADSYSAQDPHRSPLYHPSRMTGTVAMGFGNTVTPVSPTTKLSNITLQDVQQVASTKADLVKSWSVKTFKNTKQVLSEKFGKGTKTVDLALEARIEVLRDTKRNYENLLRLVGLFAKHFTLVIDTQKALGASFGEMSVKSQELQEEFRHNAETQAIVAKNGEALLKTVDNFMSNVNTLCRKTMEDCLLTIGRYDSARLTYDAHKNEMNSLNLRPRTTSNINKQAILNSKLEASKLEYEQIRNDVDVKLQFLDENRIKVMRNQLLAFNSAISAFFTGNQEELENSLKRSNSCFASVTPKSNQ